MKARLSGIITPGTESRYLKPGALAQFRDSRIRKPRISVHQLVSASLVAAGSEIPRSESIPSAAAYSMDADAGIPCFNPRRNRFPGCLRRKKLVAVTPIFTGSSSQP